MATDSGKIRPATSPTRIAGLRPYESAITLMIPTVKKFGIVVARLPPSCRHADSDCATDAWLHSTDGNVMFARSQACDGKPLSGSQPRETGRIFAW